MDAAIGAGRTELTGLTKLAPVLASCSRTLSTMYAPIGMADVAAGDGALQTLMLRAELTNRKSSIC
jgi:hypothetical protein